jgi:hypothetical protein
MRRWRSAISSLAIAAMLVPEARAQRDETAPTFQSEAILAITTNPGLAAERARVRAVRQALPQAWAECN